MMQQQRKLVGYEPKYEMVNVPVQMQVRLEKYIVCAKQTYPHLVM